MWKKTKKQQQQQQMKYINALKIEWNKQMCQVFFNVCVYAKEKINLTWPYLVHDVCLNFWAPMQRFTIFLDQLLNPYYQNEIPSSTIVCCMTKSLTCFWLNTGDWKLVSGPFMILLKLQYHKIWSFSFFTFTIFEWPLFTFWKKWNIGILK